MNTATITAILRSVLQVVAGGLITNGTLTDTDVQTAAGALVGLGALAWSIYQKIATKKALEKAADAPKGTEAPAVPK